MGEKLYKPLEIETNEICGMQWAMQAMRKPKKSKSDTFHEGGHCFHENGHWHVSNDVVEIGPKDKKLASQLILAGNDHAKAMRGIIAYFTIRMQVGFMIEFDTYRIGVEGLSTTSAMHSTVDGGISLAGLKGPELAEKKQAALPYVIYERDFHASYQALRSMYKARRGHRHPDWQILCDHIETLPYFDCLILPEGKK